jgi:hypothetical protein
VPDKRDNRNSDVLERQVRGYRARGLKEVDASDGTKGTACCPREEALRKVRKSTSGAHRIFKPTDGET